MEIRKILLGGKNIPCTHITVVGRVAAGYNVSKQSIQFSSVQFSSVTQLCPALCDPMNCSMPGFLVQYQLPKFNKFMSIESVMPFKHPIICRPLLLPLSIFPNIRVFSNESILCIKWPKYWSFNISPSNECSGLISFRDGLAGSPCSPRDSQESSTLQFKSINSLVLSFLYSPTLTSIHDYWKTHSFD